MVIVIWIWLSAPFTIVPVAPVPVIVKARV